MDRKCCWWLSRTNRKSTFASRAPITHELNCIRWVKFVDCVKRIVTATFKSWVKSLFTSPCGVDFFQQFSSTCPLISVATWRHDWKAHSQSHTRLTVTCSSKQKASGAVSHMRWLVDFKNGVGLGEMQVLCFEMAGLVLTKQQSWRTTLKSSFLSHLQRPQSLNLLKRNSRTLWHILQR